jgi:Acetyltransferase (GNAT) domain
MAAPVPTRQFEGRSDKRIPTILAAELWHPGESAPEEMAFTENVSLRGARVTAAKSWQPGTRVLVTFRRNGVRSVGRVAYCQRKESGAFAIGVDLSGHAPHYLGTQTESRTVADPDSDYSRTQGRWSEKRVELRFLLGEIRLFAAQFSMFTLDAHFTDLLRDPERAAMAIGRIPPTADGFLVRSLPVREAPRHLRLLPDSIEYVPAQYQRFYIAMQSSFEEYLHKFSSKSRNTLRRKVRRFTESSGGQADWREYRTAEEMRQFYGVALQVSALTYQERLLKAGLPKDENFQKEILELASRGLARGYLLYYRGRAIAYMLCTLTNTGVSLYRYVGYDPEFRSWSPGTVLFCLVFEKLFSQRDSCIFDFTEGEGDQKRFFATASVRCADVYHFRRGGRVLFLVVLHSALDLLSQAIVRALDRLKLRTSVKKFLRSRA